VCASGDERLGLPTSCSAGWAEVLVLNVAEAFGMRRCGLLQSMIVGICLVLSCGWARQVCGGDTAGTPGTRITISPTDAMRPSPNYFTHLFNLTVVFFLSILLICVDFVSGRMDSRPSCPPPIPLKQSQQNMSTRSRYTPLKRGTSNSGAKSSESDKAQSESGPRPDVKGSTASEDIAAKQSERSKSKV